MYTPQSLPEHDLFTFSDADNEKILSSAIIADVDVLVAGDKHYDEIEIERPEILSPASHSNKQVLDAPIISFDLS